MTCTAPITLELTNDSVPDLSMVYYLAPHRRQKALQLVDMDMPLPKMTWLRNPVKGNLKCNQKDSDSQIMKALSDSIELHLKDLKHHLVIQEIPPFKAPATRTTTAAPAPVQADSDVEEDVPLPPTLNRRRTVCSTVTLGRRRRAYQTRQLPRRHASTSERRRLPPRSVTVPRNIFLEATENRRTSTSLLETTQVQR